jgi:hypothetical protein
MSGRRGLKRRKPIEFIKNIIRKPTRNRTDDDV